MKVYVYGLKSFKNVFAKTRTREMLFEIRELPLADIMHAQRNGHVCLVIMSQGATINIAIAAV